MKQIKKSGLGDETEGGGDGASPRQVWVEGEGGNDTDHTEDESTLMGMGSAAFIPGYPPPHPDLIWCVSIPSALVLPNSPRFGYSNTQLPTNH